MDDLIPQFDPNRVINIREPRPHSETSIRTLVSDLGSLGASWAFSFQPVLPPVSRPLLISKDEAGPGVRRSHRNSALGFRSSFLRMLGLYAAAGIALWLRLCSGSQASPLTHKRCSNTASFLAVAMMARFFPLFPPRSASFRPPTPQVAVHTERSQNVLCPLHQQRSQIGIAFLADVHLRLALSRVSFLRAAVPDSDLRRDFCGSDAHFQRQQEGQRDQCTHSLHLLQQSHLRIALLRQRGSTNENERVGHQWIVKTLFPIEAGPTGLNFGTESCKRRRDKSAPCKSLQPICIFAPLLLRLSSRPLGKGTTC